MLALAASLPCIGTTNKLPTWSGELRVETTNCINTASLDKVDNNSTTARTCTGSGTRCSWGRGNRSRYLDYCRHSKPLPIVLPPKLTDKPRTSYHHHGLCKIPHLRCPPILFKVSESHSHSEQILTLAKSTHIVVSILTLEHLSEYLESDITLK